jgi:hypothetical protein
MGNAVNVKVVQNVARWLIGMGIEETKIWSNLLSIQFNSIQFHWIFPDTVITLVWFISFKCI